MNLIYAKICYFFKILVTLKFFMLYSLTHGEMSEWSNVHAWKACVLNGTAGSNPVLSARQLSFEQKVKWQFFYVIFTKNKEVGIPLALIFGA